MEYTYSGEWSSGIGTVTIGSTKKEGGTRKLSYKIGGDLDLPFIKKSRIPLVAFEICDDLSVWPDAVKDVVSEVADEPAEWAQFAEKELKADLVRLNFTSTKKHGFTDFQNISDTLYSVIDATELPLIIEGSYDAEIDSQVFQRCGEAGEGENLLLGTAEADRYKSVAAAAMAYGHSVIAQTPIDVNLAKQLNILLRETGLSRDRIVIDPYTGALGYGFEYTYSTIERIRFAALKGDTDLAVPMICAPVDNLTIKEVREAENRAESAVAWELSTSVAAAIAGTEILVVRHPDTVRPLKEALFGLTNSGGEL